MYIFDELMRHTKMIFLHKNATELQLHIHITYTHSQGFLVKI